MNNNSADIKGYVYKNSFNEMPKQKGGLFNSERLLKLTKPLSETHWSR